MSDVNKQLVEAARALADEAFQNMVGGKGHLIDEVYAAIAASEQAQKAESVNQQMLAALKRIGGMTMSKYVSAGEAMSDAKRLANEAISAAQKGGA